VSVRVIGIGTLHGDDAAGLRVASNLARSALPDGVSVRCCERGVDLLDALGEARVAVIVDAMRSGSTPGTVRRIPADALRASSGLSTHALGVGEALSLACALGRAPQRIELVGIEAGAAAHGELSVEVEAGIGAASALVRALVEELVASIRS
jgi:hydrogenase maturation protease